VITLTSVPTANPDVTVRDIGEETIILSQKGDMLHTLNAVGAFLWRSIDGRRSVRDILSALLREYAVGEATARDDVRAFFEELQSKGLVTYGRK